MSKSRREQTFVSLSKFMLLFHNNSERIHLLHITLIQEQDQKEKCVCVCVCVCLCVCSLSGKFHGLFCVCSPMSVVTLMDFENRLQGPLNPEHT